MKVIKGLVLFCFSALVVSSCFTPPEFGIVPEISFNKIEFKVTPDPSDADSLILYIDFKDGNGDLGLDDSFRDDPYHELNFYFEDEVNSAITRVGTVRQQVPPPYASPMPMIETLATGKLVTNRTRTKSGFGFLPVFNANNLGCRDYTTANLLIAPSASNAIDASYNIIDTLFNQAGNPFFVVQDTLYFEQNLDFYNIIVRFYQSTGGPFTEFSWEDEFCTTFNGRFPVLSDQNNPLEGTIRYAMPSTGFTPLFSIKTLRLDVIVKDRALNKDSIQTPEFKLADILVD